MKYERFETSLILPFSYDPSFYEAVKKHRSGAIAPYFCLKPIRANLLNRQNEMLWKDEQHGLVHWMELQQSRRTELDLHGKENAVYHLQGREDLPFKLSKVHVWLFRSGEAYLTLRITGEDLSAAQVLDLLSMLQDIKAEKRLLYQVKKSRDEFCDRSFTLRELMNKVLQIFQPIGAGMQQETIRRARCLSYGITAGLPEKGAGIFFEKLRLNAGENSGITESIRSSFLYRPERFPYIHWVVSEDSLTATAELGAAAAVSENSVQFLRQQLGASIFQNYLMVYLYYMGIRTRTEALERQNQEALHNLCAYPSMRAIRHLQQQLVLLTDQFHINTLFYNYLCLTVWNIPQRLERLEKTSENDVFISYRRKYGGYPARLLYQKLKENGCKVFYDYASMQAGNFETQLEKAMKNGMYVIAVLTPGCLEERTGGEKDYMIEELRRALHPDHRIRVLNVLVDGFFFPEKLPEGLEELEKQHGIYMDAENLDSALERVAEVLRRG